MKINYPETESMNKKIKQAMMELVLKKTFSKITVENIIQQAHINRSTFYYHFEDKYQLRDAIIEDMTVNLDRSIPLRDMPHDAADAQELINAPMIQQSISYMHKEKELFLQLSNPNWEYDMYRFVEKHFERAALEWGERQDNKGYDLQLFAKLYAVCAVATVIWSFENDVDEQTVSKIINSHMRKGFYLAFTDPDDIIKRVVKRKK